MCGVSLIIIQYGDPKLLYSLFQSLDGHKDENIITETIIVNNGEKLSDEHINKIDYLSNNINKKVVNNDGESYSSGVNRGVKESTNDILVIANNDVEWIENSSISPLISDIQDQKIGLCSPQLINQDGTYQTTSLPFHSIKSEIHNILFYEWLINNIYKNNNYNSSQGYKSSNGYITGAFIVTKRNIFEDLSGFDEYFDFYGEDVDYCYRIKNSGYDIGINDKSHIVHLEGASSSIKHDKKYESKLVNARIKFIEKHHGRYYTIIYIYLKYISFIERIFIFFILYLLSKNNKWKQQSKIMKVRLYSLIESKERPRILSI